MIQLSNLTATPTVLAPSTPLKRRPTHNGKTVHNTRSADNFNVSVKHSKNLITIESSRGGCVCVSIDDLLKLGEAHDPLLCAPKYI